MTPGDAQGFASGEINEKSSPAPYSGGPDRDSEGPKSHRLAFIEGMRALCAIYVVLGHIGNIVDPSRAQLREDHSPMWMQYLLRPFAEGHLAVASFIVISGFCLSHAALERNDPRVNNVWSFFKRRFERILPAYYACLLFSMVIAINVTPLDRGMPFAQYIPVTSDVVAAHIFLVHNLRPEWMYKINGVLWSIAIEFQLYFVFPGVMRLLKRWGWFTTLLIGVGFAVLIFRGIPHGIKLYSWYGALFVGGAIGAGWARRKYFRTELALLGIVGVAVALYGCNLRWEQWKTDSAFTLGVLALLVYGSHAVSRGVQGRSLLSGHALLKGLRWKPLVLAGSFSYSLYLLHHPLLQTLFIFRPKTVHSQTAQLVYLFAVGLPLILFLSFLFGLVFEGRWVRAALARFRT